MKLFGTDGIRAQFGYEPLTANTLKKIGYIISKLKPNAKVIIGKDTRQSSNFIEKYLIMGLRNGMSKVSLAGVTTTPLLSILTKKFNFDYGIMITASHNPYKYNGLKIFDKNGEKIHTELELFIEKKIKQNFSLHKTNNYNLKTVDNLTGLYINYLRHTLKNLNLKNINVTVDCANGSCSVLAKQIFENFNANIKIFNYNPDGKNINLNCGALYPNILKKINCYGSIGISYDGDGDRVVMCDEELNIIDGNLIAYVCARWLKKNNLLKRNTIVTTILSNKGIEIALKKYGIKVVKTNVGDKNVYNLMKLYDYSFGYEPAGHALLKQYAPVSDAIFISLLTLKIIQNENKSLRELTKNVKLFPQVNLNVDVKEKKDLTKIKGLTECVKHYKRLLNNKGKILVRYSGTEPKLRIVVESENAVLAKNIAEKIKDIAESKVS